MNLEISTKGVCRIENIEYPSVGFGTYPLKGETCFNAVTQAAELGYRIIDTATFYKFFFIYWECIKKVWSRKILCYF